MTHDERASLIKKIFMPLLIVAIAAGVWFYQHKPAAKTVARQVETRSENTLSVVLHRLPGDPASERMSEILHQVQAKYERQVVVSEVNFKAHPEISGAQGVTKPPHVVILAGNERAFDFQGSWSQAKVERKVEEILRGLRRVGKDWRPAVPGMKPARS